MASRSTQNQEQAGDHQATTHRPSAPGGMEVERASSDMASTLLLRSTRWLGEGMSTGAVELANGETGRGGGEGRESGGGTAAAATVDGMFAGVEAGRGGGERRARLEVVAASAGAGAEGKPPGSEAGCETTLAGREEAEERETSELVLPPEGFSVCSGHW